MKQLGTTLSFAALLVGATALFGGCIGNSSGSCSAGQTCSCDGIGNCDKSCPSGDCDFVCEGIGNCNIDCQGGSCDVMCSGTGNCILDCEGGGCTQTCEGTGNCICNSGCEEDTAVSEDAGTMSELDGSTS